MSSRVTHICSLLFDNEYPEPDTLDCFSKSTIPELLCCRTMARDEIAELPTRPARARLRRRTSGQQHRLFRHLALPGDDKGARVDGRLPREHRAGSASSGSTTRERVSTLSSEPGSVEDAAGSAKSQRHGTEDEGHARSCFVSSEVE